MSALNNKTSWIFMITTAMKTILDITKGVYSAIELDRQRAWKGDPDVTEETKRKFMDNMNMAAFITDNGIINIGTGICALINEGQKATINLSVDGSIVMDAAKIQGVGKDQIETETPSSTIKYYAQWVGLTMDVLKEVQSLTVMGLKFKGMADAAKAKADAEKAKLTAGGK